MSKPVISLSGVFDVDFDQPTSAMIKTIGKLLSLKTGAFGIAMAQPRSYWMTTGASVFTALKAAFDRPITQVLADGWNYYQPFLEFCDPQKHPPEVPAYKELFQHSITLEIKPSVKVLLNRNEIDEIEFPLTLALDVDGGMLTIKGGRFMRLSSGKCRARATLKCKGAMLLERKSGKLELPGELSFGDGIRISPMASRQVAVPAN